MLQKNSVHHLNDQSISDIYLKKFYNKMPKQILDNFMDKFFNINNKLKQQIKNLKG